MKKPLKPRHSSKAKSNKLNEKIIAAHFDIQNDGSVTLWNRYTEKRDAGRDTTRKLFMDTKNPLLPIEAFLWDFKMGKPIREWIICWLAEAFEKYYNSGFKIPLDVLLGFKRKGKRSPLRSESNRYRDAIFLARTSILLSLGIPAKAAILAAAEKFLMDCREHGIKPVRQSYLRKKFYAQLKTHPDFIKTWSIIVSKWTPGQKKSHLLQYPLLNSSFKVT